MGWGIEGAIGSCHKIDPSYLSPHVNLASRLESLTKTYGVSILLSNAFVACLERSHHMNGQTPCHRGINRPSAIASLCLKIQSTSYRLAASLVRGFN